MKIPCKKRLCWLTNLETLEEVACRWVTPCERLAVRRFEGWLWVCWEGTGADDQKGR